MNRLKSVLGYIAAILSLLIMLGAVMSNYGIPGVGEKFASAIGLVTSPNYSGGELVRTIDHQVYQTEIHRPVFDALIGETKEGFIQIGWRPSTALPAKIDEAIDIDADGQDDFQVVLDTGARQAVITAISPNVIGLEGVYTIGDSLAIRVKLINPKK